MFGLGCVGADYGRATLAVGLGERHAHRESAGRDVEVFRFIGFPIKGIARLGDHRCSDIGEILVERVGVFDLNNGVAHCHRHAYLGELAKTHTKFLQAIAEKLAPTLLAFSAERGLELV